MKIKEGDIVSYKGIKDTVEEILNNEVRIQNQEWKSDEDDDDIGFWIWVKIIDLDKTHGGKRPNSGAKPKYNEQTKTTAFRIPISKIDEVKKLVREFLASCERENNQ